jgi:predicted acyltransferase
VYLLAKGNIWILAGALAAFIALNICIHGSVIDINPWVIKDGSSASLMMFGVAFSLLYLKYAQKDNYKRLWTIFTIAGVALIALGFFIRPYTGGISKIHSTPAWVFICTGIGVLVFEGLIWLIDVRHKGNWFGLIKPAGTSTLTAYLLPYLVVAIFGMAHFRYPHFFDVGAGGIIRSFAMAFILIIITGLLEKKRLRLKI